MSFPKFVSFLEHGVYLARADRLGDDWEGSLPAGTRSLFHDAQHAIQAAIGGRFEADLVGPWKAAYAAARVRTFVSCWQMAERDLWWMWKVYCDGDYGVAVRTTYAKLCDVVPDETDGGHAIKIGLVTYDDYARTDYVTDVDVDAVLMSKRLAFRDESEVRVLCDLAGAAQSSNGGVFLGPRTRDLIMGVTVSPLAPEWFMGTVKATCRAFGCAAPVEASHLSGFPPAFDAKDVASG